MKAIICLFAFFLNLFLGIFIYVFVLSLGLLGASSERMTEISFFVFRIWIFLGFLIVTAVGYLTAYYFVEKTAWNNFVSFFVAFSVTFVFVLIFNFLGFVLATIIGNLRVN